MKRVLLDTGVLVAALDRRQQHHASCREAILNFNGGFVTCESVISEACFLLRAAPGAAEAIMANVDSGLIEVRPVLPSAAKAIAKFLRKYADQEVDFADACLVSLAGELGSGKILTLDSDFRHYRWGANRPFELLLGR